MAAGDLGQRFWETSEPSLGSTTQVNKYVFLAQATFGTDRGDAGRRDELANAAQEYLAALLKNGQICGEPLYAWSSGRLVAYAHLARPDAAASKCLSKMGRLAHQAVVAAFRRPPQWKVLDDEVPRRFPRWQRSPDFYLATDAFDDGSPLHCGETGQPILAYLLPATDQTRESLYFWARSYQQHDNLWLGSAGLEIPAYRQLAEPDSELSATGRVLCREIEQAAGKPTFYYLQRYWGRRTGEEDRKCPACGRPWRVPDIGVPDCGDPNHSHRDGDHSGCADRVFHQFDFRCIPCRLVSHRAASVGNAREAGIGERKDRINADP